MNKSFYYLIIVLLLSYYHNSELQAVRHTVTFHNENGGVEWKIRKKQNQRAKDEHFWFTPPPPTSRWHRKVNLVFNLI